MEREIVFCGRLKPKLESLHGYEPTYSVIWNTAQILNHRPIHKFAKSWRLLDQYLAICAIGKWDYLRETFLAPLEVKHAAGIGV